MFEDGLFELAIECVECSSQDVSIELDYDAEYLIVTCNSCGATDKFYLVV